MNPASSLALTKEPDTRLAAPGSANTACSRLRCLLIYDSDEGPAIIVRELRRAGFEVLATRVDTLAAISRALADGPWDIVFSEYELANFGGLAALDLIKAGNPGLPFVLVSREMAERAVATAVSAGADDCLAMDKLARLVHSVRLLVHEQQLRGEHQAAIRALQLAEQKYRNIFEHVRSGILQVRPDGRIIVVNSAFARIFGYESVEIFRREVPNVVSLYVDPARRDELKRRLAESGAVEDFEINMRHRKGKHILVTHDIRVARGESGEIHFEGTAEDITERRSSENALRLQSAALTAAANGIVITDRAGAIVWVNPAFTALTGYAPAEAVGRNPRDLVRSGQQDRAVYQRLWETILAGQVWHGELVNRRKDGTHYHEDMTITPVRTADGEITHFIAIKQDLTERQQALSALERSERHYRALTENSLDVVTSIGIDGQIRYESSSVERVLGWRAEELVGQNLFALVHPEDVVPARALVDLKLLQPGFIDSAELRFRHKDGSWHVLEVIATNMTDDATVGGIVFNARDVTERKVAEAVLQREQSLLSGLLRAIPDYIYFKDRQSRFVRINDAFARRLGLPSADEIIGKTDADIFTAEHARQTLEDEGRIIETGEMLMGLEEKETWSDGTTTWASTTKVPIRDSAGTITGLVGISRDITARKLADDLLREQNEILTNSNDGVMIVDLDNRVTLWNSAAEKMFGWSAAEALGRSPEQLLGVDDARVVATLHESVKKRSFWSGEVQAKARDGRKVILECRITMVRNEAGQPRGRLNTLADVTDKKMLEEKFLHAQRLESLGMLAAGIAHDLNNVLTPIGFAGPLLRKSLSNPRDLEILDLLETSGTRGAALVKQILGFVHNSSSDLQLIQAKHLARDVVAMMEETFPKSVRIVHEIAPDAWPLMANPTQIHQVLVNLCINARDAMPHGGELRLEAINRRLDAIAADKIKGASPGAWLMLAVADTGTGIPAELLSRIWEPFFTSKGAGRGTGLGLSTVSGIVARHHGFVEVETEVGRGTTFRVFLPAVVESNPSRESVPPMAGPIGDGELILVVDDEKAVLNTISMVLSRNGYRVQGCDDSVKAFEIFRLSPDDFALVVTDEDMPQIKGSDLAHMMTRLRPGLPVLSVSGLSPELQEGGENNAGALLGQRVLKKPFKVEHLLSAIHRLLHPSPAN